MSSTHVRHHSLEGNNPLRGTDYMEHAPADNQGIVDGRPEGRQPQGSPVLLDTVVDPDASTDNYLTAQSTLGATPHNVYKGLGVSGQGMSSTNDQPKRRGEGGEQCDEGVMGEGCSGSRVNRVGEGRWVGKTELREAPGDGF